MRLEVSRRRAEQVAGVRFDRGKRGLVYAHLFRSADHGIGALPRHRAEKGGEVMNEKGLLCNRA